MQAKYTFTLEKWVLEVLIGEEEIKNDWRIYKYVRIRGVK